MAMTKRIRVSFDLKMVCTSDMEADMNRNLVELTKAYASGEKLDGIQAALVKAALEGGPESALELALKKSIKEELVEAFDDGTYGVANLRFEVKR